MWIAMNDAFVSIVEDRNNKNQVVVRARVAGDLEDLFPEHKSKIIETEDSDYRFRLFLDRQFVSKVIQYRIMDIDYDNFKNSVKEKWRKDAYMGIWSVMYKVQEHFTPGKWWAGYRK